MAVAGHREGAPLTLLIALTPNFNLAATTGFIDPFRAANYLEGRTLFSWWIASEGGGPCPASNGMVLETAALSPADRADIVVISSSWTPEHYATRALQAHLRRAARRGATICGLDTGAFLMARAGLLTGRRATVHYEHIDALQELHPDIEVAEDLYVIDGKRITCCGGAAAADLALEVIRRAAGDAQANAAARYIFHHTIRPGAASQSPGLIEPLGGAAPEIVRQAIKLMEAHLEDPPPIPDLCARLGVSQRQLDRQFQRHLGRSPVVYFRDIRLDRARGLVTQTEMPLAEVAIASGFRSQVHFSRAYKARFGLPPRRDRVEGRVPFEFRAWPMHRPGMAKNVE